MGIDFYKRAGEEGGFAHCGRCGQPYASQLQIADLKSVQKALCIQYQMDDGSHYQDVCPQCRRKNLALSQDGLWRTPEAEAQRFAGL